MHYDCLIVDDEVALSQSTCEYFNLFGVNSYWVADAPGCLAFFEEHTADLILLDISLGESSGFELCRHLRETINVPILFISARQSDDDKILALTIGGDDYVQKPYSLSVLLAKVRVVLQRYRLASAQPAGAGGLVLDVDGRFVILDNRRIELKTMEFKLLHYLIQNKGRVIGKEELFDNVWQDPITSDNTLNVHIRRLREKLEADPNNPTIIKTVWGTGYVYEETPS